MKNITDTITLAEFAEMIGIDPRGLSDEVQSQPHKDKTLPKYAPGKGVPEIRGEYGDGM